jgi:hypothetical protein
MDMDTTQALALRRYDVVRVRRAVGKRTFRALVTDAPTQVDGDNGASWVLVPYALESRSRGGSRVDCWSSVGHVAVVGGSYPDHITRDGAA